MAKLVVFGVVIYFQGIYVDLLIRSARNREQYSSYPIKLFYTCNNPKILQSSLFLSSLSPRKCLLRRLMETSSKLRQMHREATSLGKDVAKQLKEQQMVMHGRRDKSVTHELNLHIQTAATFRGLCIGARSLIAEFMEAMGIGTGILLAVTIVC
ncbi:hypothetical protein ANCDUO_11453 [Ancylostoma duodenale]|uniref:Uncharacterized protein n=1 Tax=Ancylostoma duodenale TaxID=51022 RepID=A0A0C2D840_9BILA|nr:hypothetical protein ANCDUO_11453 [Ancylostoma duodenale]